MATGSIKTARYTQGASLKAKTDEKNALQARSLGVRGTPVERQEFSALAKSWDKKFSKLTQSERKQFIRKFLGRVEILPNQFRIRYNYDHRMVTRAVNVLDLATGINSAGIGLQGPVPSLAFSKRSQRAWDSDTICIGRGDARVLEPIVVVRESPARWKRPRAWEIGLAPEFSSPA